EFTDYCNAGGERYWGNKILPELEEFSSLFYLSIVLFVSDAMRSLQIEALLDQAVNKLSGGERQRVFITLCLGKPADIYLIDEPSAHLDSKQHITSS
ncbi:hypothetical protein DY000_02050721, partial [Brassica cretica]